MFEVWVCKYNNLFSTKQEMDRKSVLAAILSELNKNLAITLALSVVFFIFAHAMRKTLFIIVLVCLAVIELRSQAAKLPELALSDLKVGDLIFAVNNRGNAITASTSSSRDLPIDHVGIVFAERHSLFVLEAVPKRGVSYEEIDSFIQHNQLCIVGRVANVDVSKSLKNAWKFISLPYDSLFEADDSAIYCSELVQKSYVDSLGQHIFGTIPMSFSDSTGTVLPYWTQLYRRHGRPVPEGEPGTNPAQLARDPNTDLVGWLRAKQPLH